MTRITDKQGFYSTLATTRLIKQIKEIKPDVILLHHLHGYFINIKLLFEFLEKVDIPIVWTFHDCWSFTGHCTHFDFVGCDKWKTQCYSCPQKMSYPSSFLFDNSRKNYDVKKKLFNSVKNMTIVPVSYWLGDLVVDSFLGKYPIRVIQNGINLNVFNIKDYDDIKTKYNIKDNFVILGVASTWDKRKGLYDFIKLSKRLKEDEIIILVGLSKKQIKQLPHKIIGIQRTENVEELAKFYSMADVFVNPTYEDTFPTTNLEALACGTPIITYKTGGSVESVDNSVGFRVEKGDVNNLLFSIKIIKNKGKDYYSQKCIDKAIKHYNRKDRFKEYIDLFSKLIDENK